MNHGIENDPQEPPKKKQRGGEYPDHHKELILHAHNELGLGFRKIVTRERACK